jgi:hypothetical protein
MNKVVYNKKIDVENFDAKANLNAETMVMNADVARMTMAVADELTDGEANRFIASNWWEELDDLEAVHLQLKQDRICMPFEKFHSWMEKLLERPIFTHEITRPDLLLAEYESIKPLSK